MYLKNYKKALKKKEAKHYYFSVLFHWDQKNNKAVVKNIGFHSLTVNN